MLFFDEPVAAPAVPEKTFPIIWIRNLQIQAHDPNAEGHLYLELLPMAVDRELYWGNGSIQIKTDHLYQAMNKVPEVAAAFDAILNCIKPLQAWIASQQQGPIEESE